jgi:hypothetical protein
MFGLGLKDLRIYRMVVGNQKKLDKNVVREWKSNLKAFMVFH